MNTQQAPTAKTFTTHGELPWISGPPDQVGLVSKNGELANASEIEARFESFELRPLSPTEKKQASFVERGKLRGKWSAIACKLRGKELTGAPLSQFIFTDSAVTLTEGDKQLKGEYSVDATSQPKCILVTLLGDQTGRSLSFSYQIERGRLTLCCDLRPGSPPPATLTSEEGDTRLLITLAPAEAAK